MNRFSNYFEVYYKEKVMLHAFECSKVGSKHEVCQDYSMSKRLSDGIISAIADGVGSAKNSDKGSYIAVNTVVDSFLSGYAKVTNVYDAVALVKKCYTDAYNAINLSLIHISEPTRPY